MPDIRNVDAALAQRVVDALSARRKDRGISDREFAEITGLKVQTIRLVEQGLTSPLLSVLLTMARALEISLAEVVSEISEGGCGAGTAREAAWCPFSTPLLETVIDLGADCQFAFVVTNNRRETVYANRAFHLLCGYEIEDVYGSTLGHVLQGERTEEKVVSRVREQLRSAAPFGFSITNYHAEGREYVAGVYVIPVIDSGGGENFFLGLERELFAGDGVLDDPAFLEEVCALLASVIDLMRDRCPAAHGDPAEAHAAALQKLQARTGRNSGTQLRSQKT